MALTAGDKLGPYEILSLLGKGGMGEVYKARDPRLDRVVAVKVSHAEFTERFEREARSIAALNHPNVCQLYDVGHNYLVMEFVEGAPIAPPDTSRKLLDMAVQIADGLAAAHAAGIVHRDLKPDNILITGDGRVKILDFGLAKAVAGAGGDDDATQSIAMSLTDAGTTLGTIAYMSPEQARGKTNLTAQSDQFSFGLVLYEMAAGKRAFQRGSGAETMTAIIREDAETLPTSVPAHLRWIVERLLSKEPAERYDSTRDLYRELRQVRERMSESASAVAIPQSETTLAPTRRKIPWAAIAVVLLLGLALTAVLLFVSRQNVGPDLAKYRYTPFAMNSSGLPGGPRWSPDGKAIAWLETVDGRRRLLVRNRIEKLSWLSAAGS